MSFRQSVGAAALAFATACGFTDRQSDSKSVPVPTDSVSMVEANALQAFTAAKQEMSIPDNELAMLTSTAYIDAQRHLTRAAKIAERRPKSEQTHDILEAQAIVTIIRRFRIGYLAVQKQRDDPEAVPKLLKLLDEFEKDILQFPTEARQIWRAHASLYHLTSNSYSILLTNAAPEKLRQQLRDELLRKASTLTQKLQ